MSSEHLKKIPFVLATCAEMVQLQQDTQTEYLL